MANAEGTCAAPARSRRGYPSQPETARTGLRPLAREAAACGVPVIGELELAARLCDGPILAVTGTNGKSTTTALCAHLLERSGVRVFLGGNIGRPLSDMLLEDRPVDQLVVEVSSFQLEHLSSPERFVPHVAVWLNLTPDHIDRHGSLAEYADVKRRMFEGQGGGQTGIFFLDDEVVRRKTIGLRCDARGFSRHVDRPGPHDLRIDGRVLHAVLLEIFTDDAGVGTLLVA